MGSRPHSATLLGLADEVGEPGKQRQHHRKDDQRAQSDSHLADLHRGARQDWRPGMTERGIWDAVNAAAALPGVTPAAPLQPIEGRVVMLQAGIKAAMAVRIYGDSLEGLSQAAVAVSERLKRHPLVNSQTVAASYTIAAGYSGMSSGPITIASGQSVTVSSGSRWVVV